MPKNTSVRRKLFFMVGSMALLIAVELTALFFMKQTLSSCRTLISAEGVWAKSERDAIYRLNNYGFTQDDDEYKQFQEKLAVPLGDRKGRMFLTASNPDLNEARAGFKEGQIPPAEIDGVMDLLTRFRKLADLNKMLTIWELGDNYIVQLQDLGVKLHQQVNSPKVSSKEINKTLDDIYLLNEKLNVMEDNFSFTLQEGSKKIEQLIFIILASLTLTIWFVVLYILISSSSRLGTGMRELVRIAQKISKMDFTYRASIKSNDETGQLATSLNTITDNFQRISASLTQSTEELKKRNLEQKVMENALQKQRGLYETMLKTQSELGEGVCITEGKQIIYMNDAVCKISGYSREELSALPAFLNIITEEGNPVHNAGDREKTTAEKGLGSGEIEVMRRDGEKLVVEYRVKNYFLEGRNQTISIIRDITERKRSDEQLRKEKERAESAEIARKVGEQFLANMSHEIRTPMNAILGFTDVLIKTPLTGEQRQCTDAIKTSGDNLLVIINDILDFSRMHSGKLPIEKKEFKLTSILSNCIELMLPKAMEKGLQLSSTVDKNVPNNLIGDPTRLTQVLINLVSNSLKFTEKGYVSISVRKLADINNDAELEFSVKDTGIGISQDKLLTIFDAFIQADNATARKYGGTGLGLAIVKQLADLQGASISVSSSEGEGSCFNYRITYARGNKSNEPINSSPVPEKEVSFTIKDINVLVVEDNAINQLLIKKILSKWGWTLEVAENGLVALKLMEHHNFDVVLMDIQLPEMNGYEATQIIRTKMPPPKCNIPIIAMTANVMASEEQKCYSAGMNDYISKPFNSKTLYTKVVTLLNKKNTFAN
jgi:PAS domain S-box-containing protein